MPKETKNIFGDINGKLTYLQEQVNSLHNELTKLQTDRIERKNHKIKIKMGEFDTDRANWNRIGSPGEGELYKYLYTIPITYSGFSEKPEIFTGISAYHRVDPVWIYPDKISVNKFNLVIETDNNLHSGNFGLVVRWLAVGS